MNNKIKHNSGQAMVEYAILIFGVAIVFYSIVTPLCEAMDSYAKGIYYILQAPFP